MRERTQNRDSFVFFFYGGNETMKTGDSEK
jgi:hypothetical protein